MAEGWAPARTALAGNPSDGYGGAVLAVTVEALRVEATTAPGTPERHAPGGNLVDATIRRFRRELLPANAELQPAVRWSTTIPRSVGLGGSSAILIAILRALAAEHSVALAPDRLAELAWSIEREDLGIPGGRQDQVALAYGGVTLMDFGPRARVLRLDRGLLPPLLVAWRASAAEPSGIAHRELRTRWDAGEPAVRAGMTALTSLAGDAAEALRAGDRPAFRRAVDASFDVRAGIMALDPRHVELVQIARAAGAAANYSGSGGAIVAVCDDASHREAVAAALVAGGCGVVSV